MTDQIQDYLSAKLTKQQKRASKANIVEALDIFSDQNVPPVPPRAPEMLRQAQINLADMALENDSPQDWLSDVLKALDLHRIIPKKRSSPACGPYIGTRRGYNTHLRTYTRPCPKCKVIGQEGLAAETARRGVPEGASVKWPV